MPEAAATSEDASHLLSFLRIGTPSILIGTADVGRLTDLGFGVYLPSVDYDGFASAVNTIPASRLAHRLTTDSVELLDAGGQVIGRWSSPRSRVWRVVAAPPVPMWVAFFAVSGTGGGGASSIDETAFRSLVDARRIVAGHVAPQIVAER